MIRMYRILLCCAAVSTLTGCKVGPNYVRPQVPTAPVFKEALPTNANTSTDWKTAVPNDQIPRGKWWLIFGDTQLSTIEEQVLQSNQDLALAEARLREARAAIRFNKAAEFPTIQIS